MTNLPDPTPPANSENDLYIRWSNTDSDGKELIEQLLTPQLKRHASKVCWMVLHANRSDLIGEIVQDALVDLSSFKGSSLFSTWFHARALYRCRREFRQQIRRREIPLEGLEIVVRSSLETDLEIRELVDRLPEFEQQLVQLKVFEGFSDEEVAQKLGFSRQWIQMSWTKLRRKLKNEYDTA